MNILVLGGTRFFGIHMVNKLLEQGHDVTIATRGNANDDFGDRVKRIVVERTSEESMRNALKGNHYDVIIDKIAYCSNDIKLVLDYADCNKYIYMSSASVYNPLHIDTQESDYDGHQSQLVWCDRTAFSYDEIKRQAENALCQKYSDTEWIAVRYPFVLGKDDYTNRLMFYVEHIVKSVPMFIDNMDSQLGLIKSDEAGEFIAHLVDKDVMGPINGCSEGTISVKEIVEYIEKRTGKKAIINTQGENAPYNGVPSYSLNTEKALRVGYRFSKLQDWIFDLIDYYIEICR